MKTAISLPDDLFASTERLAKRLGISRSRLFATALAEFAAKNESRNVTARLDAVYSKESGALDPALRKAQKRALKTDAW